MEIILGVRVHHRREHTGDIAGVAGVTPAFGVVMGEKVHAIEVSANGLLIGAKET